MGTVDLSCSSLPCVSKSFGAAPCIHPKARRHLWNVCIAHFKTSYPRDLLMHKPDARHCISRVCSVSSSIADKAVEGQLQGLLHQRESSGRTRAEPRKKDELPLLPLAAYDAYRRQIRFDVEKVVGPRRKAEFRPPVSPSGGLVSHGQGPSLAEVLQWETGGRALYVENKIDSIMDGALKD
ncbi:hypothetical protein cyc_03846 [Cyclospora cayetanensis]|uniref:Uncharacterized protein n=1 Tax=Cyclospora cayetanensis TaxID=88456 RepID=A0A1D3D9J4_9EIME|nr:hypothetical protein cyc_03846 [Cyclospora cayetanensis]